MHPQFRKWIPHFRGDKWKIPELKWGIEEKKIAWYIYSRVFFIESLRVICYKILKISLFMLVLCLEQRYQWDIWYLTTLNSVKCPFQPTEAQSLIDRKSTKMLFFDHTWSTIFMKNQIINLILWSLVQNIINITFLSNISCKIWI